jgi:hypothetical protein
MRSDGFLHSGFLAVAVDDESFTAVTRVRIPSGAGPDISQFVTTRQLKIAAIDAAGNAAKAAGRGAKNLFSLQAVQDALEGSHADIQKALDTGTQAIQDDWHQTVRGLFDRVAQEAGVTPEKAESLHDVAAVGTTKPHDYYRLRSLRP